MTPAAPSRSIRLRLQLWYAAVLVAVIGGFAGALYYQVRGDRLRAIDVRLESAAGYLAATVRGLPPHEFDPRPRRGRREPERFRAPPPVGRPPREPSPPARRRDEPDVPRPGRDFGPLPDRPPADGPASERPALELPASLLDAHHDGPRQEPYFVVWRPDRSVLALSPGGSSLPDSLPATMPSGNPPGFRWRDGERRELLLLGPRGSLILVGRPAVRELAELRTFAWQLAASGLSVLVVGLAGGWLISHSITRPIAAIARTASEISASNLSRRIETSSIDQELVGLATILNAMFARLEAAFERQSRFTSDASHEMRTPLAVIHAHAELALSKPRSADEYRETLGACLGAAARMATLVDGLLTLARADAGRLDLDFREVDLRGVVGEVVEQYRPQAETAHIVLSTALVEPLPVNGDAALLARVSSNLLSNALRYTPQGGHVSVSVRADAQTALLVVEDSGCGIPLEDQSKVFERFFRADKARNRAQGGNGLGLAICKTLVEVHRGSIGFTSAPDRGTRFEVRLPLVAGNGGSPAKPLAGQGLPAPSPAAGNGS